MQCQYRHNFILAKRKYMYSISNQEPSIKCIWKFVSFDKNPLLRGWKLLEFKWGKTAFGEQTTKVNKWYRHHPRYYFFNLFFNSVYVHWRACIHYKLVLLLQWPRGKVALNAPFPTGRQNALNLLKIVKLTQNVRTNSNIVKTNNWRALTSS